MAALAQWWLVMVAVVAVETATDCEYHGLTRNMFSLYYGNNTLVARGKNISQITPNDLEGLNGLYDVDFSSNNISHINMKAFTSAYKLIRLNFEYNSITDVPIFYSQPSPYNLRVLSLSNNQISKLEDPDMFVELTRLEFLLMDGNFIDYIHKDIFRPLENLRLLRLQNNMISHLPHSLFSQNKELETIDLSLNLIEYLPMDMFSSNIRIKTVLIANNRLSYLPSNMFPNSIVLFVLDLSSNRLIYLPDKLLYKTPTFSINLSYNPWQCACLNNILIDVKRTGYRGIVNLPRGEPVCFMYGQKQFRCIRDYSDMMGLQTT